MISKLTDSHARNARPREKAYKLFDGGGLFLLVTSTGKKRWRYKYRIDGRENLFAIGDYPEIGLKQARESRDQAKVLVKKGTHPSAQRQLDKLAGKASRAATFELIGREWIEHNRSRWSPSYAGQVVKVLEQQVFNHLGSSAMSELKAQHILALVDRASKRGAKSIAILIRQWCSQIFRYAVMTERAEADPCSALKGVVQRPRVKHKTALPLAEVVTLVASLDSAPCTEELRIALRLLALTFVRPGELREAMWCEFDFDAAEWRIPGERMKMKRPHIVPLATQSVEALRRLQAMRSPRAQLFPNTRDPSRAMSPMTMNRVLERMGLGGKFSAHGFRATASTILNESGYRPDIIERQLAHGEKNIVRASYNHATYLPERKKMMQNWADLLLGSGERIDGTTGGAALAAS